MRRLGVRLPPGAPHRSTRAGGRGAIPLRRSITGTSSGTWWTGRRLAAPCVAVLTAAAGGRWGVVQLVERRILIPQVGGSKPPSPTSSQDEFCGEESAAGWLATGLENRGGCKVKGSTPSLSASRTLWLVSPVMRRVCWSVAATVCDMADHTTPSLTGRHTTRELPRITKGAPVTVSVAREVLPGYEGQFLEWAERLLAEAREHPGYLGGGVLHPGTDGGEHEILVRFLDATFLRQWERSPRRTELLAEVEPLVATSRAVTVVGEKPLFSLAQHARPDRPVPQSLAGDVIWVLPVAIGAGLLFTPLLAALPLLARGAITTTAITVVMHFIVAPVRRKTWRHKPTL